MSIIKKYTFDLAFKFCFLLEILINLIFLSKRFQGEIDAEKSAASNETKSQAKGGSGAASGGVLVAKSS